MWVREIAFENFRNMERQRVILQPGLNIIYGDNAQGKTNFLEAVYFCATGCSQRAGTDRELVCFGQKEAHVKVVVESGGVLRTIDAHLFESAANNKKKGIAIDHIPISKLSELFGLLLTVIFTPEDLRIVKAGPSERRVFMDIELCQLSAVYYHALRSYHHALKQRNKLLKSILKDRSLMETLSVWDEPLCRYGSQIMAHRQRFITELGKLAQSVYSGIAGESIEGGPDTRPSVERLTITYRPNIPEPEQFAERLRRGLERDLAVGSTSAGIHKDDMLFAIDGNDTRVYGSQGQQRTAALAAKLAEIEIIKSNTGRTPILLLDDVLSELDDKRQKFLLKRVGGLQTILTCTGVEDILRKTSGDTNFMRMERGRITPEDNVFVL